MDEMYLPMLQPLQFAKGWKEIPEHLVAITDLEPCPNKDCKEVSGNTHIIRQSVCFVF